MSINNKSKIKAVFDDDLEMLLNELGVLSKFKHGKMKCSFCSIGVNKNNLHSIFPDSGAVKFCCDTPDCIKQLINRIEEKPNG